MSDSIVAKFLPSGPPSAPLSPPDLSLRASQESVAWKNITYHLFVSPANQIHQKHDDKQLFLQPLILPPLVTPLAPLNCPSGVFGPSPRPKLVHMGPLLPKPIEKTSETYQIQVLLNKPPLGPLSPPDMTLLDPKGSRTSKNIKSYIVESLEKQIRQKSSWKTAISTTSKIGPLWTPLAPLNRPPGGPGP